MEEESLFHFENEFNMETYNRLQDFYILVIQKGNMIALLIFYILSILAFVYGLIFLDADIKSYLIVEGVFTGIIITAFVYPKLKKIAYKKIINSKLNKKIRKQEFTFFGDYLSVKEGSLEAKYKYVKIYKVYVTNTDFFFCIDKNIAFILPKNRITEINKFEEFLVRKFQTRFIKKYNKNKE